jgi:hypothetical protein
MCMAAAGHRSLSPCIGSPAVMWRCMWRSAAFRECSPFLCLVTVMTRSRSPVGGGAGRLAFFAFRPQRSMDTLFFLESFLSVVRAGKRRVLLSLYYGVMISY